MSDGIESYDSVVGDDTIVGFEPGVDLVISEATIGPSSRSLGTSGGPYFQGMRASFSSFQKEVDANLVEQKRVGGIVVSMFDGVHQRITENLGAD